MGYISILLLSFFISLGFSIFIIPRILLISFKKHLFDIPDERKVHQGVIPRLGGVSFCGQMAGSDSAVHRDHVLHPRR